MWPSVVHIIHHQSWLTQEGSTGRETQVWPQTWPPWKTTLLTCCSRAVCVGGILCTYMSAARFSFWMSVSVHAVYQALAMSSIAGIPCSILSMSNKFNTDALSHPVSAWNIARACDFSDPREAASWNILLWWYTNNLLFICDNLFINMLSHWMTGWVLLRGIKLKLTWKLAQLPTCRAQTSRNSSPLVQSFNEELVVTDGKQVTCVYITMTGHTLICWRNVACPPNISCTIWMWYCVRFCWRWKKNKTACLSRTCC